MEATNACVGAAEAMIVHVGEEEVTRGCGY